MSAKLIKNNRLATLCWYSLLFILIFSPTWTIAVDQQDHQSFGDQSLYDQSLGDPSFNDQAPPDDALADQPANSPANAPAVERHTAGQTNRPNDASAPAAKLAHVKLRKQRFIKKELTHQNHQFHSNYYSSMLASDGYRSPADYSEQSDAYTPHRSSHNRSALTGIIRPNEGGLLTAYSASGALPSASLLLAARGKLAGHLGSSTIQGPVFQAELPARVSFSNNSGLVLNCAATGNPTPQVSWQTETGISVLSASQSIDSLNLLNLNTPLVHQNPSTNALVFRSFAADEFSPEVHSTKYRCLASNQHGTITSPLVQVKAGRSFFRFFFVHYVVANLTMLSNFPVRR